MSDLSLESLLDTQLDDLADLPEFGVFPNGAHIVTVKVARKNVNNADCIEISLVGQETQELENPEEDTPIKQGSEMSVLYQLANEYGAGALKKLVLPLNDALSGGGSLGQILMNLDGQAALAVTKKRVTKDKNSGESRTYGGISSLQLI